MFYERMGWEVSVVNAWEIDGYDVLDPLYVLSINRAEQVVGSLRLLPTTGFNMLNDTFPELLPDGARIEGPLIWESSRFSVDHESDEPIGEKGLSRATIELGLALNEIGMRLGLSHIVTVYDAFMHRMFRRAGCAGEPIGPPKRIGSVLTYAVHYEIGEQADSMARAVSGLVGSVIEPESLKRLDFGRVT